MALIKCKECGKEISDQAATCPNCGCPVKSQEPQLNPGETIVNGFVINPKEIFIKNNLNHAKTSSEIMLITGTDKQNADRIAYKAYQIYRQEKPKKKSSGFTTALVLIFIFIICSFGFLIRSDEEDKPSSDKNETKPQVESSAPIETVESSESQEPEESEEDYKASCSSDYKYKDVLRNPENYIGQRIVLDVKVTSVHKEGILTPVEYFFARTNDEHDWWFGDAYGIFNYTDGELKILSDDVIRVWGEISEPQDTQSIIVNSEERFCVDMKYVELISE